MEKSIPPKAETIIDIELTTVQKKYYRAIYERNFKFLKQVDPNEVLNVPYFMLKSLFNMTVLLFPRLLPICVFCFTFVLTF